MCEPLTKSSSISMPKESATERSRKWRLSNLERFKSWQREHYAKNKKAITEKVKKWSKDNPGRSGERYKAWAAANPERVRSVSNTWRKSHPECRTVSNHRRRSLTKGMVAYSHSEWETLKAAHKHSCLCCGRAEPKIKLTADHVMPLSLGGAGTIDNIQPLCKSCNSSKGTRTTDYRLTHFAGQE